MSAFATAASQAFRDPDSTTGFVYKCPSMRGFVRFLPLALANVTRDSTGGTAPQSPAPGHVWEDTSSDTLKVYSGTAWIPAIRALQVSFCENAAWPDEGDSATTYTFQGVFAGSSEYEGMYFWRSPTTTPLVLDGQLFDLLCRDTGWEAVEDQAADPAHAADYRW